MRDKEEFLRILRQVISVEEGEEDSCREALYAFMEDQCGSR